MTRSGAETEKIVGLTPHTALFTFAGDRSAVFSVFAVINLLLLDSLVPYWVAGSDWLVDRQRSGPHVDNAHFPIHLLGGRCVLLQEVHRKPKPDEIKIEEVA